MSKLLGCTTYFSTIFSSDPQFPPYKSRFPNPTVPHVKMNKIATFVKQLELETQTFHFCVLNSHSLSVVIKGKQQQQQQQPIKQKIYIYP